MKALLLVAAHDDAIEQGPPSSTTLGVMCDKAGLTLKFVEFVKKRFDQVIENLAMKALLEVTDFDSSDIDGEDEEEVPLASDGEDPVSLTGEIEEEPLLTPSPQSLSRKSTLCPGDSVSQQGDLENEPKVEEPFQQASTENIVSKDTVNSEGLTKSGDELQPERLRSDIETSESTVEFDYVAQDDVNLNDLKTLENFNNVTTQSVEIIDSQAEDIPISDVSSADLSAVLHHDQNTPETGDGSIDHAAAFRDEADVETKERNEDSKIDIERSTSSLDATPSPKKHEIWTAKR
ncbi:uncharacterized protein BDZ99DRAFT_569573 [Mytilinidion resinicola]|uniref:Uncharacterized protein n=1 Tax=Mytilinidion resinicola TaxID=574789 RepID=A0A6A6YSS2_9PEZI|nr:uncharacterized protein BDZ99DRAFT_569573 [Mytilinidion resinicola]KAF2811569.1 hypothetical protein BDZ99DRAFT_569573 [Mytilinidion resinicola]